MTTIDWNQVRRRLVTQGLMEEEAVAAAAIMADGVRQTEMTKAAMLATRNDMKHGFQEFERRLTNRFAVMCLLSVVVLAIAILWLL